MDSIHAFEAELLDKLRNRQWRPGDRLPTERAFSQAHGLSRASVRRVLGNLKARGLITQTVGSGTYVSARSAEVLAAEQGDAGTQPSSPAELMAARLVLEPAIVELVVLHANAADFDRMLDCCDRAEAAETLAQFEHWDSLLHELMADAAHNAVVSQAFRMMTRARAQGEWGMLKRRSVTPERRLEYQREHRALVQALAERDAPRARELCAEHLLHVRRNMMGY